MSAGKGVPGPHGGTGVDLSVDLAGLRLPNPVMTASGRAGSGRELEPFLDLDALGALVTRSVTLEPRAGFALPRLVETPSGMLNGIGLQGNGVDGFLATELPWLAQRRVRTVVSLAAETLAEYAELAGRIGNSPGVSGVEVNLGWPPGAASGRDSFKAAKVVSVVRRDVPPGVPVLAKLAPEVHSVVDVARAVAKAGADGVVLVNSLPGMALDPRSLRPALGSIAGGLSGPAIHAYAVRCVWEVHRALPELPVVGVGGVRHGFDAVELLAAGATAVQVGTAVLHDPAAPARVTDELLEELARRGLTRVADLVGHAHRPEGEPS
jgi:dihydroorotate dehydrogenase (NAD+) catalytic subunit